MAASHVPDSLVSWLSGRGGLLLLVGSAISSCYSERHHRHSRSPQREATPAVCLASWFLVCPRCPHCLSLTRGPKRCLPGICPGPLHLFFMSCVACVVVSEVWTGLDHVPFGGTLRAGGELEVCSGLLPAPGSTASTAHDSSGEAHLSFSFLRMLAAHGDCVSVLEVAT